MYDGIQLLMVGGGGAHVEHMWSLDKGKPLSAIAEEKENKCRARDSHGIRRRKGGSQVTARARETGRIHYVV